MSEDAPQESLSTDQELDQRLPAVFRKNEHYADFLRELERIAAEIGSARTGMTNFAITALHPDGYSFRSILEFCEQSTMARNVLESTGVVSSETSSTSAEPSLPPEKSDEMELRATLKSRLATLVHDFQRIIGSLNEVPWPSQTNIPMGEFEAISHTQNSILDLRKDDNGGHKQAHAMNERAKKLLGTQTAKEMGLEKELLTRLCLEEFCADECVPGNTQIKTAFDLGSLSIDERELPSLDSEAALAYRNARKSLAAAHEIALEIVYVLARYMVLVRGRKYFGELM